MIRLKVRIGDEETEHPFDAGPIRIGRSRVNEVVLDHPSVARLHCAVEHIDDAWRLMRVGGETQLNGMAVREQVLHDGDRIDLGEVTITFLDPDEAASLKPAEPLVVSAGPDAAPESIVPNDITVQPPEPETEAAEPIAVAATADMTATKVCPYCGHEIPEAATVCKFCKEPLEARARRKRKSRKGNWSLLSAKASATRGVTFRQMVAWVRDGTINENSSVSGPPTQFQWRFACETPRISKYLGVCYQCGAAVKASDEICPACRINLDDPGDAVLERTEVMSKRKTGFLRVTAAVAFILVALAGAGYTVSFTRVGRWMLTDTQQKQVQETVEGLFLRAREQVGPEQFSAERARIREAEALREAGDYEGALRIYTALQVELAETDLAGEIAAAIDITRDWQRAYSLRVMAGQLVAQGNPRAAFPYYLEIKERYGGSPAAVDIDQRIAECRRAAPGGP